MILGTLQACPLTTQTEESCKAYCERQGYISGRIVDLPKRCQCGKYEKTCGNNSADNYSWKQSVDEEKTFCYYDICTISRFDNVIYNSLCIW